MVPIVRSTFTGCCACWPSATKADICTFCESHAFAPPVSVTDLVDCSGGVVGGAGVGADGVPAVGFGDGVAAGLPSSSLGQKWTVIHTSKMTAARRRRRRLQ